MRSILIFLCLMPLSALAVIPVTDAALISVQTTNGFETIANQIKSIANETQSLTNEASMITNEYNMIKNQETMLKGLTKDGIHISDINNNLNQLSNISSSGAAITYATNDISNKFDQQFSNDNQSQDTSYSAHNKQMMQSVLDSSKNTIQAAQAQMNYTQSETDGLKQITSASNSADGLKAVMQGTNELLNSNAAQLQNLSSMQAQQNSLVASQVAANASQEQAATKEDEYFLGYTSNYEPYKGDEDLASIPNFN